LKTAEALPELDATIPHMVLFPLGQEQVRGKRELVAPGTARKLTLADFQHHFGVLHKREYSFLGDFWLEPTGEAFASFPMPQSITRTAPNGEVLVRLCGHSSGAIRLRNGDKISVSRGQISVRLVHCADYDIGESGAALGPEWISRTRQIQVGDCCLVVPDSTIIALCSRSKRSAWLRSSEHRTPCVQR
jgi:hypothetical protein